MKLWALIDCSFLAYRAKHSVGQLSHGDMETGVIYGFLEAIRTICRDPYLATNQVAICCDSKHSIRKTVFSDYKGKRHNEKDPIKVAERVALHKQIDILTKEVLPAAGFVVWKQAGLESDDLMAQAAKQLERGTEKAAVIVTSDGDLYQCIGTTVHWYDPQKKLYYDPLTFWKDKGIACDQWGMVKAIGGCGTDEVPGVGGVAEDTAIDYLNGHLKPGKRLDAITCAKGQDIIRRNKRLVMLPNPNTQPVDLAPPTYNPAAFYKWGEKLGIASYLDGPRRDMWDAWFAGKFSAVARTEVRTRTKPVEGLLGVKKPCPICRVCKTAFEVCGEGFRCPRCAYYCQMGIGPPP